MQKIFEKAFLSFSPKRPNNTLVDQFEFENWDSLASQFISEWKNSYFPPLRIIDFSEIEKMSTYNIQKGFGGRKSTQSWARPPGINHFLINKAVRRLYRFVDGSTFFPINYTPGLHQNFFTCKDFPPGTIFNPPYQDRYLNRIITRLIMYIQKRSAAFAIIAPERPQQDWYKLCNELGFVFLHLFTPLKYLRGTDLLNIGKAPFKTCIILIGVTCTENHIYTDNTEYGFPLNTDFLSTFINFSFPKNIVDNNLSVSQLNAPIRARIVNFLLQISQKQDLLDKDTDITHKFDLSSIVKFNFMLQNISHSFDTTDSQQWAFKINPIASQCIKLEKFLDRDRKLFSQDTFNEWLDKFILTPSKAISKKQCRLCHNHGHFSKHCPLRIPTAQQLGLCDRLERHLYDFLTGYITYPLEKFNWTSILEFHQKLNEWNFRENKFWKDFKAYLQKFEISDFKSLLDDTHFSKSRQALGFNHAMGAPLYELILDSFGAQLHLLSDPAPCQFVKDINNPFLFDEIPDTVSNEDTTEIKRGTQMILPKKHIKYILPRFTVINTDTTTRTINDCRFLGPFTPVYRYRLPTKDLLRNIGPNDLVLSIDGKSAYRQRRLCNADSNKIGFQTKINNLNCFVAMSSPPFGMHNAGYVYQKSLQAKLDRITGNIFYLEYIDDVSVVIGTKSDTIPEIQWRAEALLYLITRMGEIFNDKFNVSQDKITLLGVNYFVKTDRFTPKISSFYKLGLKILHILQRDSFKLKDLETFAGLTNWLIPQHATKALAPIYKALSFHKKGKDLSDYRQKIQVANKKIPVTKPLLDTFLDILLLSTKSYFISKQPRTTRPGPVLRIVSDANPSVSAGFMVINKTNFALVDINSLYPDTFKMSSVSPTFVKKFKLEKILNSYFFETLGILKYIEKKLPLLTKLCKSQSISEIKIYCDNLGLIQNLQAARATTASRQQQLRHLHNLLESLDTPFSFHWLRRSTPPIDLADNMGRPQNLIPEIGPNVLERIFNKWGKFHTPDKFQNPYQVPHILPPGFLTHKTNSTVLFPLPIDIPVQHIQSMFSMCFYSKTPIILGFPLRRRQWLKLFFEESSYIRVKKITTVSFPSSDDPEQLPRYSYIFGIISPSIEPRLLF